MIVSFMVMSLLLDLSVGCVSHFFQNVSLLLSPFFFLFSTIIFDLSDLIIVNFGLPCLWEVNFF